MDGAPKKYEKGNVYAVSNDPNSCGRGLTDLKRAVFTFKKKKKKKKLIIIIINRLNDVKSAISFSIWNTF